MSTIFEAPLALLLAKVTIVFAIGLVIASRKHVAPMLRHTILLATICAALLLPLLSIVAPRWNAPVLPPVLPPVLSSVRSSAAAEPGGAGDARTRSSPTAIVTRADGLAASNSRESTSVPATSQAISGSVARTASPSAGASSEAIHFGALTATILVALWLLGALALLLRLAAGHLRLRAIARRAWHADDDAWRSLLREECAVAGVSTAVRLLVNPAASTPLTWGTRHPVVLLPEDALEWSESHRRIVLRHELAHVARRDALAQSVAAVACALYWFHPLAVIAARRLRAECERACDDRVVASGTRASEYASHLLDVARAAREIGAPGLLSLAMARPSQLEGRLLSVLDSSRELRKPSRGARVLAVTFPMTVALVGSAFHPVARPARATARMEAPIEARVDARVDARVPAPMPAREVVQREPNSPLRDSMASGVGARQDATFDRSVAVRPGGTLRIDLRFTGGSVTVTGWDQDRVEVRGRLGGRDWRNTEVRLEESRDGAELRTDFRGDRRNANFSHTFEIRVPRRFDVVLSSAGGGIELRDLRGRFSGSTGGGTIDADRLSGEMRLSTGGGDVLITNSVLDGTVSTGGGSVRFRGVTGELRGSSGSGDVRTDTPRGRTEVDEVREREREVQRDRDRDRERVRDGVTREGQGRVDDVRQELAERERSRVMKERERSRVMEERERSRIMEERNRVVEETRQRALDSERDRARDRERDRTLDRARDQTIDRVRERQLDRERDNTVRERVDSLISRVLGRDSRFDGSNAGRRYSDSVVMRRDRDTSEVRMGRGPVINTTSFLDDQDVRRFSNFGRGGIMYNRAGGSITIDEAPRGARVTTGGGAIRIGASSGEVYARTGGGDVTIGPARGSVVASTGAGEITVRFEGGGAHSADLVSGYGRATLTLPDDISATLVLESAYTENFHRTRIDNAFGGDVTETPDFSDREGSPRRYVRSRVRLGRGEGTINVRVVNGDIVIRRAGDSR